jgi:hypothetical protein
LSVLSTVPHQGSFVPSCTLKKQLLRIKKFGDGTIFFDEIVEILSAMSSLPAIPVRSLPEIQTVNVTNFDRS